MDYLRSFHRVPSVDPGPMEDIAFPDAFGDDIGNPFDGDNCGLEDVFRCTFGVTQDALSTLDSKCRSFGAEGPTKPVQIIASAPAGIVFRASTANADIAKFLHQLATAKTHVAIM